jgi:hypothetical protein
VVKDLERRGEREQCIVELGGFGSVAYKCYWERYFKNTIEAHL